uniref:Histone H1 n=1 Tax=Coccidioides posadasii RMSCC 3488 TaxID=454284 RepID=A0A0J6F9U6_COCPO|nr:hypothetical protein, variant [Coccidioides posadasii RMSCC 3488]
MPPKKAAASGTKTATHASYKDMIKDAIISVSRSASRLLCVGANDCRMGPVVPMTTHTHPSYDHHHPGVASFFLACILLTGLPLQLKDRTGSSRQALKKYVRNNNNISYASQGAFDVQFNRALKAGVEKGEFLQPKGPSGPVKLAKKETVKPAAKPAKKPAAAKAATKKTTTTKKAAEKGEKVEKAEKPEKATKKAAPKKTAAAKTKANVAKQRKAPTAAPAVVDAPKVIGRTKSGRVTKSTGKSAPATTKKATPKKKKVTEKKTPSKKSEA